MYITHVGHRPEAQEVHGQRGPQVAPPEGGAIHPQGQLNSVNLIPLSMES